MNTPLTMESTTLTKNKILLVTGGTGSFGNAVLKRYLNHPDFSEIRIFSRDEKKQDDMRHELQSDKLKFFMVQRMYLMLRYGIRWKRLFV